MRAQPAMILAAVVLLSVPQLGAQLQSPQQEVSMVESLDDANDPGEVSQGRVLVIYENGDLTIKANRAPLLQVLHRVCEEIGAEIDAPSGASELIMADLGPGPAREVLSALLSGSAFNYAMQATDEDPRSLARLILMPSTHPRATPGRDRAIEARTQPTRPDSRLVPEPTQSAVVQEQSSPKETIAEMKNVIAQTREEIGASASDTDESLKEGAAQLLAMLEKSIETPGDQASPSNPQPTPTAPAVGDASNTPSLRHRRRSVAVPN